MFGHHNISTKYSQEYACGFKDYDVGRSLYRAGMRKIERSRQLLMSPPLQASSVSYFETWLVMWKLAHVICIIMYWAYWHKVVSKFANWMRFLLWVSIVLCELVERMQETSLFFLKGGSERVRILRFRRPESNRRRRHYSLMPEQKLSPSGNQMSAHGNKNNYSVRKFKSDVQEFDVVFSLFFYFVTF